MSKKCLALKLTTGEKGLGIYSEPKNHGKKRKLEAYISKNEESFLDVNSAPFYGQELYIDLDEISVRVEGQTNYEPLIDYLDWWIDSEGKKHEIAK